MPQQTNLNVAPYFDDFEATSDYHKVLFKPGYPVQARELNSLQSILQNQIEKFGQHFFKEGAKVIPGNTGYTQLYYGIQLNNNFQGVPISAYIDQLIGTKITGKNSGVTATVDNVLLAEDSERNNLTLYCAYISSNTNDNSTQQFSDGEDLLCSKDIVSGLLSNATIPSGSSFATTIPVNAAIIGSAFQIQDGVYFVRGQFLYVNRETLILDQYSTTPNYRIGLYVNEQIVTADQDQTLNDNSQGYNNYASPGADRLKISLSLFKKQLTDVDDNNFVELARVTDGIIKSNKNSATGSFGGGVFDLDITDTLARRTFDESGDYYVKPFDVSIFNSLNNNIGNGGIFQPGQFTYGGDIPSDNLGLYKIAPGKAYVRGYEIETINTTWIDVPKPRTKKTLENQSILYNTGLTLDVNKVWRSPTIGIGNTYLLSLRDQRVGVSSESAPGNEIGIARVYDYKLDSGSYSTTNDNLNEWGISLYDVQSYTNISLNISHTLTVPCFIEGESSGATGFLRSAVSAGTAVTVYGQSGDFIQNEALSFNGVQDGRIALAVTSHSISDVKSLYGMAGYDGVSSTVGINTFSANVIQSEKWNVGIVSITVASGAPGISTVRSDLLYNPSIGLNASLNGDRTIKIGDLVQYTDTTLASDDPVMARVTYVGSGASTYSSYITIAGVTTISGLVEGKLPTAQLSPTNFKVLTSNLNESLDNSLYTVLPKANVSDVDLTDASITIRKSFTVDISSNEISSSTEPAAGTNETFLPYNDQRYSLVRSDGSTESLNSSKIEFNGDATVMSIRGLGDNDTGATFVASLKKSKPTAKKKIKNRVNSIIVDKSINAKSGIGSTTADDGLDYGTGKYPYGTRVQDKTISLNTPDIVTIHGIYESADTSSPAAPKLVLTSFNTENNTNSEVIIGELLVGQSSGAVAICAEKLNATDITYILKNGYDFKEGELLEFQESLVSALVSNNIASSFAVGSNYTFKSGQKNSFYNYGVIERKSDIEAPDRQLKIYFESSYYDSTDEGDITTINSYDTYNYGTEIQLVDGYRNSDMIDIRPRVSTYTVVEGSRSPLEFLGREFNGSGNSAANILASNESIVSNISYYQGRIDRIYLSKEGEFQVIYGTPSDNPQKPNPIDNAIEIATITLPPYLYNPSSAEINYLDYKRFRMSDINKLEKRIKNLEYYTALSLLEVDTANMFIPDNNGLNRYKSGFFVDNFGDFRVQDVESKVNNSIDKKKHICRPQHYTTEVDLMLGPVENVNPTQDLRSSRITGSNVRKNNDVLTLNYSEVVYTEQSYATRSESVTPFLISFWQGTIELTPASDTWVSQTNAADKIVKSDGDVHAQWALAEHKFGVDRQTGFSPITWDSWQTNWTGQETKTHTATRETNNRASLQRNGPGGRARAIWDTVTFTEVEETFETTWETGESTRTGKSWTVEEYTTEEDLGTRVIDRTLIPYMRNRNIEFNAKAMKPLTRLYAFFDGENVTKYCVPKLLEITMTSGTFQVSETVTGHMPSSGLGSPTSTTTRAKITFRVAQSNHKEGDYNSPSRTYAQDPYTYKVLPPAYSSTSNILNIDTYSLSHESQGDYFGWVEEGMVLIGKTSGATATVRTVRLQTDISADIIGSYYVTSPTDLGHYKFETGTKVFTLTNDKDNHPERATTLGDEQFTASGTMETLQKTVLSIRNARIKEKKEFESKRAERSLNDSRVTNSTTVGTRTQHEIVGWYDPLAQSFLVEEPTGVFVTKCDVFFRSKDDGDIPVTFQLRTMKNGFPTQHILPFSEIVLPPNEVEISADGTDATTFQFKAPVYLPQNGNDGYAIALASNSTKYSVFISRIGETDLTTQKYISNQPTLGSLFKSQNASTWEASQWEDLKFTLYRANFLTSGSVDFYSPALTKGNNQIARLLPNAFAPVSRTVRVGLGTTVADSGYEVGNTFLQQGTNATANLVGTAGTVSGLTISNPGIGYTPLTATQTFGGTNLVTLTGNGRGATADIHIENGVAVAATISGAGGNGYKVGDVLGITTIGIASVGRDIRLSVSGIGQTNELIFENVQGDFVVGAAKTLMYYSSAGIKTELNWGLPGGWGGDVQITSITQQTDGLHLKVNHKNHGMYATNNIVEISGVESDIKPTKLSVAYPQGSTGTISVDDASNFSIFENVGVGTTNVGFLRIEDEIIQYTNTSSGNLIGGTIIRGDVGTIADYPIGTPVYKYENSGVNLKRINGIHTLSDATISDPITFDSYHIKLDMSKKFNVNNDDRSTDVGFPALYLKNTKSTGGADIRATQNIPFETLHPLVENLTVSGTSLTGEIRTTTGTSISGNEISFANAGYEPIVLNSNNYFDSPRMIASKTNETAQLINIPGNKSMNLRLFLQTSDSKISPVIDTQRVATILSSNRVNNVITNYATDKRVNDINNDPTAFQYISKEIGLENSATSIKILLAAHIHLNCDIRAFYAISDVSGFKPIFTPFPGYNNLNSRGQIISKEASDGQSDSLIPKSNDFGFTSNDVLFREYSFTADNLPSFRSYKIKIVLTSTTQSFVPQMKDLRVMALA